MKTLKEEVMELLMKRIGVAENEEFEAQFTHEECQVNKFCNGELLISSLITFNALNRALGNCFRTKESAEAHKEEILKILKGEDDE